MQKIIIYILSFLLVISFLYVFTGVLFHPLQSMDALGIWLFKAKAMYVEHGFPNQFLHNPDFSYSHQHYPLGLPFVFFTIYSAIGGINEKIILFIYPLLYIGILVLCFLIFKRKVSIVLALFYTYLYAMLPIYIASGGRVLAGGADIFIVGIEWVIIFLLYKNNNGNKDYIFVTLLIIIASQIKLEGAFLSCILLFLPVRFTYRILYFFASLIPFGLWIFVLHFFKIPSDSHIIFPSIVVLFGRIAAIFTGTVQELLHINNWYIFWPVFFSSLLLKTKMSQYVKDIFIPSYIIILLLFIAIYLFASNDTYTYVSTSLDRVLFQHSAIIYLIFFEKTHKIISFYLQTITKISLSFSTMSKKKRTK